MIVREARRYHQYLGSYVQASPGRSLADAHSLVEDLFNHFVLSVYNFDGKPRLFYDEVNQLLLNHDYDAILSILATMSSESRQPFSSF